MPVSPSPRPKDSIDRGPGLPGSPLQIRSWSELRRHVEAPGKREAYKKLLVDFGFDPEADAVRELSGRPALLFAEQPGCWFTPRDLVRARLLERLVERGGFDPGLSGARTLAYDRFTAVGDKAVFLDFTLHPKLGPVRMVGSQYLKKYEHRTYASLRFSSHTYQRARTIWDYALRMIEAAAESPQQFAEVVGQIFDASPPKGVRDILPLSNDPAEFAAIGEDLARCRLEPAFKALWPARSFLQRDISWSDYWAKVNSEFLGLPIEPLEPLLGRFLLAVEDPIRLGRRLHEESGSKPGEPISVAGIVSDDDVFRPVYFEPRAEEFFLTRRDGSRRMLSWEEIRACAQEGRGGRPSGILEYLLFAAFGIYLLVDAGDSVQPFHETTCRIHQRFTGLGFPWITFPVNGPLGSDGNSFVDIFRPDFVELTVDVLTGFFER